MSGKTEWVKKTASTQKHDDLCTSVKKVLFCYRYYQPFYTEKLKIMLDIAFHQGMSKHLVQSKYFDPKKFRAFLHLMI